VGRAAVVAALLLLLAAPLARASTDAQLLARYEPVLVLHAAERFSPVAVEGFLQAAQLEERVGSGWSAAGGPLPTADPPGCSPTPCWRLRMPGCSAAAGLAAAACYADTPAAAAAPAVYGAALRRPGRIALQYWYWYVDDFWSGRYPPTDEVWQAHEGDWEVVTVVLTSAARPLYAGYSQHECGKRRAWTRVPKSDATHPVAYVALGSHANYYAPGDQPLDLRPQCYDPVGAAILRADLGGVVLDRLGGGRRLARLPVVPLTPPAPAWLAFPGAWGEANLFHAPDPVNTRVAGAGPAGPRFHALWRDPIGTVLRWPAG
jgi:hypothetical protein